MPVETRTSAASAPPRELRTDSVAWIAMQEKLMSAKAKLALGKMWQRAMILAALRDPSSDAHEHWSLLTQGWWPPAKRRDRPRASSSAAIERPEDHRAVRDTTHEQSE